MDVAAREFLLERLDLGAKGRSQPAEDVKREEDDLVYGRWQAEAGCHNVFITTITMIPVRIRELYFDRLCLGNAAVLIWYSSLFAYALRCVWVAWRRRERRSLFMAIVDRPVDASDTAWLIALQLNWVCMGHCWFLTIRDLAYLNATVFLVLAVHLPMRILFGFLLPLNAGFAVVLYSRDGYSPAAAIFQSIFQAMVIGITCFARDAAERQYCERKMRAEREHLEILRKQVWAEAQRASFQGMLDSVFDASCVCDGGGAVVSSTPQLEAILGARRQGSGLAGRKFTDFADGEEERGRLRSFLADASESTTARRIRASLRRADEAGGPGERIEVTLSGINVPPGGGDAATFGRQVFVGLEVNPGVGFEPGDACEACAVPLEAVPAPSCPAPSSSAFDGDGDFPPTRTRPAASITSAPPIMEATTPACGGLLAGGAGAGDCLPGATLVRVEGRVPATRADAVELGQRVLCVDHLSGCLKYVEVVQLDSRLEEAPDLLSVRLQDGSEVQMTADHPVFTTDGARVKAEDLVGGRHQLDVLKLVSVPVESVARLAQSQHPTTIVSLSVHQPHRHSLFVASVKGGARYGAVAVASACISSPGESLPLEVRLRNTFIHLPEEPLLDRRRRRTVSDPPGLRNASPASGASTLKTPSQRSVVSPSGVSTISDSVESSLASAGTLACEDVQVVLCKGVEDRRVRGFTVFPAMKLSDVLQLKRAGLRSFGSLGHDAGWCYPCLMQNWPHAVHPCRHGMACSRCHEEHSKRDFKRARPAKTPKSVVLPG